MNLQEFKAAVELAKSEEDLFEEDTEHFLGYGLPDFKPVVATIPQVAHLIRWQAGYLTGGWDAEQLTEIQRLGRHRFIIVAC
jgi:hypothetical protein